jgi:hypothetical protein
MSSVPPDLDVFRTDFWPSVKYENLRYLLHDTYWHSGRICTRVRDHIQPSNCSILDDSSTCLYPRPEHTHGCLAYGHGRSIWRSMSFFIERWEREKREAAETPKISIKSIGVRERLLDIKLREYVHLKARLIVARVTNGQVTAYQMRVGGSVVPPEDKYTMIAFGWFDEPRLIQSEIRIDYQPESAERTVTEIGARYFIQMTKEERNLAPALDTPALVGLTVEGYPFVYIGESTFKIPYDGKIYVSVYNEKYGRLVQRAFKVNIQSWDAIYLIEEKP